MSFVKVLGATLVLAALAGCQHVETWDQGVPQDSAELKTDAARQTEYRRFVIRDVGVAHGKGYFVLNSDKDKDTHRYAAASFYPVVTEVSPEVKQAIDQIDELRTKDNWTEAAVGAGAAGMIFGPTSWIRSLGTGALIAGAGGSIIFDQLKKDQLEKVMEHYNADLTKRIYVKKAEPST